MNETMQDEVRAPHDGAEQPETPQVDLQALARALDRMLAGSRTPAFVLVAAELDEAGRPTWKATPVGNISSRRDAMTLLAGVSIALARGQQEPGGRA